MRTWESKNPQWCRLELDNFPAFANEYEVFVDRRPPPRALEPGAARGVMSLEAWVRHAMAKDWPGRCAAVGVLRVGDGGGR